MATLHPHPRSAEPTEAGGAYVRRAFEFGGRKLKSGDKLTKEEIASIPEANLTALVNTKILQLWPEGPAEVYIAERFLIPATGGKFQVVEGRRLTKKPVTKQHAQKLIAKG